VHQACHPGKGHEVFFEDGHIHIRCRECEEPVMKVMVPYGEL
jgi:hypothetical protein